MPNINNGLCECGCGQEAPIATRNWKAKGWIKGEYHKFIHGHNKHKFHTLEQAIKEGLYKPNVNDGFCECGCGEPAPVANYSSKTLKRIKGQPLRFISGHNSKTKEGSPNWRGGITPEVRRIRNSAEYADWRSKVFARDNYTCQNNECKERGGQLEAHHILDFSIFKHLRFELDNGMTLCLECHDDWHSYERKTPRR